MALFALVAGLTSTANAVAAPVPLGTAANFAVLGATTVTNTGTTVVNGDLGVSPGGTCTGLTAPCTGGGPGTVNGVIHLADAAAAQAQLDLTAAYNNAAGQPVTATIPTQLGGQTLGPGVYDSASGTFDITGTLTLDAQGDPNATFIFKTASTLTTAAGNSQVNLINGAQSCNVFWQVGSTATLGTNTLFRGNILALISITATTGSVVDGRLLARTGAVTLDTNVATRAQCLVALPPTLTVTRVPKKCTTGDFKIKVKVAAPAGIASTDVFLDGKRIKRSAEPSFIVTIKASRLKGGRHTIRIVTRDTAGNTKVKTVRFRRCQTADINFTG